MEIKNSALLTDFYSLTMAQALWENKKAEEQSVFYLFFRKAPFNGSFALYSGLSKVMDFIKTYRFRREDLKFLGSLNNSSGKKIFKPAFLNYLANLKLSLDVFSIKEGSVVFPLEPMIRVHGPLIQCQLMETPLLNLINFSTLISTKAARIRLAAQEDEVIEFGLRRAPGPDGGLTASLAAVIGGVSATSNVLAGKKFKIPLRGTHSHSWVMSFAREIDSFRAYAKSMAQECVFLVDTYSTLEGIKNAVLVGRELKAIGGKLLGIRLDSGNLSKLSKKARTILDTAGFSDTKIIASGDLDEYEIYRLKKLKSPIDIWGVGTKLVTGVNQGALDGVYKLGAIKNSKGDWDFKMKFTDKDAKMTLPGIIQARRFFSTKGALQDIIFNEVNPPLKKQMTSKNKWIDLLIPVFKKGKCVYHCPSLRNIQNYARKSMGQFPKKYLKLRTAAHYPVDIHKNLLMLKHFLSKILKGNT